jgi:uncharacterized membrane protein
MDTENPVATAPAPQPRTVDVNRSIEWLAGGFRMFMKAPGSWLIIMLVLAVGAWIVGSIGPGWMSGALTTVIGIVVVGTLMRSCHALDEGREIITDAKATASSAPLWILGLIAAGMSIALSIVTGMLGLSSLAAGFMHPSAFFYGIGLSFVVIFLLSIVMSMALWLAPALVVLKGVAPLDAIKMSLLATLKNIVPYIVYSLLTMMLCIVASIPLGLGLLVAIPMMICSWYLAYKDMFATSAPA